MNIVEAYRKALKCKGELSHKLNDTKYLVDEDGIYFFSKFNNQRTECLLSHAFLTRDDFEVIEPPKQKYGFAVAWRLMEQGKTMLHGIKLYKVQEGFLLCSGLKYPSYVTSTVTCDMINSNTWEVWDGSA